MIFRLLICNKETVKGTKIGDRFKQVTHLRSWEEKV